MRVAIIAHGLSDGGAERVASMVANHYARQGHQVLYLAALCGDREYPLDDSVTYRFVQVPKCTRATRFLHRSVAIDRALRAFGAEIAISFLVKDAIVSNLRRTVPLVYSLRTDPANQTRNAVMKYLTMLSYRRAEKIVFQTQGARQFFPPEIQQKGIIIANPLTRNLPYWDPHHHEKRIVTACRLSPQKNLPMLIRAFATFHANHPEYRLEIYGRGKELENLQALCASLKIENAVVFPGHTPQIHRMMATSAAFVLSSNFEGLSNAMLEALAIGVPTICTDCPPGGAREYITDGANGFLIPVGDVSALAEKLEWLAADPALCQKMSWQATQVRQKLNPDRVLGQWGELLNEKDEAKSHGDVQKML